MFHHYTGQRHSATVNGIRTDYIPKWLTTHYSRGTEYTNLRQCIEDTKPSTICIYRTYALGDIIMLMPVLRAFRRAVITSDTQFLWVVQERFISTLVQLNHLDKDFMFARDIGKYDYGCDLHVNLNGVLELDHRGGDESNYHRMELYMRALGVRNTEL